MNSGRSFGRQLMSSSVAMWLMMAPASFTAGDSSALTKCSGTFMWIFLFSSMRWKSTCRISFLNGCIWTSRSSTLVAAPSSFIVRIDAWNASLRSAWNSALWSSSIGCGATAPP